MTTRALRGWSLGSPLGMKDKREWENVDAVRALCGCTFTRPFLHSLVMVSVHWDGPVMRSESGVSLFPLRHPTRWRFTYEVVDIHPTSGTGISSGGGLYSYKPSHIDRMGRWAECDVIGIVSLFDTVVEHERGYRSDGCVIERLWVLWGTTAARMSKRIITSHLEETYQCPTTVIDTGKVDSFTAWLKLEDVENLMRSP